VLRIVGVRRLAHRLFEFFDYLDLDLARFVEQRVLLECDLVLVSCLGDVEPRLA
jgi:hypothetical protein